MKKNILIKQLLLIVIIIILNFLIRIFTYLIYNLIRLELLLDALTLLPTVFLMFGIPASITFFEIYLFDLLIIKKINVKFDDKISLPLYETIYIVIIAIGESIMAILTNNPSGVFLQFEIPKDVFLFYSLMILYIVNLNLYYKTNKVIYLFFMIPSIFEAVFHLYSPILISMISRREFLSEIVFLFPFLPLTMIIILLRLYKSRMKYSMFINNGDTEFVKL